MDAEQVLYPVHNRVYEVFFQPRTRVAHCVSDSTKETGDRIEADCLKQTCKQVGYSANGTHNNAGNLNNNADKSGRKGFQQAEPVNVFDYRAQCLPQTANQVLHHFAPVMI